MGTVIRHLYAWTLGSIALLGIWYYILVGFWAWQPASQWEQHYRIAAMCPPTPPFQVPEECTVKYGELASALQEGKILSMTEIPPVGDSSDTESWHHWEKSKTPNSPWEYEVSWSSWDFKESIRYRLEGEHRQTPVLVEYRHVGPHLMRYAIPLTLISIVLIIIRRRLRPGVR